MIAQRVLPGCVRWVHANLRQLAPVPADANLRRFVEGFKVVGEFAIAGHFLQRAGRPDLAEPILRAAHGAACQHPVEDRVWRSTESLAAVIPMEAWLRASGHPVAGWAEVVQDALDRSHFRALEKAPHQCMDVVHALEMVGHRHPFPPLAQTFQQTLAAAAWSPFMVPARDAYRVTHVLFYMGGFGLGAPHAALAAVEGLPQRLEVLLWRALAQSDWDLAAELLLCLRIVAHAPPVVVRHAWDLLAAAQASDGSIPNAADYAPPSGGDAFGHVYHTTLVTLMAATVWQDPLPPLGAAELAQAEACVRLAGATGRYHLDAAMDALEAMPRTAVNAVLVDHARAYLASQVTRGGGFGFLEPELFDQDQATRERIREGLLRSAQRLGLHGPRPGPI